ncbi:MAG: hypothetical protein OEL66_09495, partial [Desulfobulbaceae bacterium]|nr:hypothetical protein [Desulfobulbaceae bacterium]
MIEKILSDLGITAWPGNYDRFIEPILLVLGIACLALLTRWFSKRVLDKFIATTVNKSAIRWDDTLAEKGFFRRLTR